MTKRERFMNFLESKPVDRVPVAFFHHFCPPNEWGRGMENSEAFERNIIGHKLAREKFDPDVIKIMNDTLMIMPVDVSGVKCAADLRSVHAPSLDSDFAKKTLELTTRVRAFYADSDAPVYATGFSPSMVLRNSLGGGGVPGETDESRLLGYMAEDPEAVAAAIRNIGDDIAAINEMLIKQGGVDGIYFSVSNQNGFFTDDFYRTYVAPAEREVMAKANKLSKINLLHICGYHGRANNLALFLDFDAAAYNIAVFAEGVSLSAGKRLLGGKPVFGGFAQDTVIYKGTKEEVKAATWKILDECGQIGVMIGADCTVPNDIDDSRLNWVREAAEEYAAKAK
ncbi:uroporphyrinogen decarboxylase family protein [Pseudoflavonifractor phocaeensis]|uniref:uroporphyrinogen decarboxylase family protein n=1 Tax=Pseudoflavonifractor phocaeensis TaxID=1870988 RepID=UPI00313C1FEC